MLPIKRYSHSNVNLPSLQSNRRLKQTSCNSKKGQKKRESWERERKVVSGMKKFSRSRRDEFSVWWIHWDASRYFFLFPQFTFYVWLKMMKNDEEWAVTLPAHQLIIRAQFWETFEKKKSSAHHIHFPSHVLQGSPGSLCKK